MAIEKKRVLIFYPPTRFFLREDRCQAPMSGHTISSARFPVDMAYMAAVLERAGLEVSVGVAGIFAFSSSRMATIHPAILSKNIGHTPITVIRDPTSAIPTMRDASTDIISSDTALRRCLLSTRFGTIA